MLTTPAELVGRAKATVVECTVRQAQDCLSSGALLLDIREPHEFQRGHIPGAINVPRGLLEFEILGLVLRRQSDDVDEPEDQPIVLYCGTGGRSALAAQTLDSMGYKRVTSMSGGITAWTETRLPVDIPG